MSDSREFRAYRITNTQTGSAYIGITRHSVERRWREHVGCANRGRKNSALYNAIRAYGKDAFVVEHIASSRDWNAIVQAERLLIDQHGTLVPNGYNLVRGVPEDATSAPRCFTIERKPCPPERREYFSRLFAGRIISEETRALRRETLKRKRMLGIPAPSGWKKSDAACKATAKFTDVSYAGVVYPTAPKAAAAAGVTPNTFRHWIEVFGQHVPFLSDHERYALRHIHGKHDARNRAHRMAA